MAPLSRYGASKTYTDTQPHCPPCHITIRYWMSQCCVRTSTWTNCAGGSAESVDGVVRQVSLPDTGRAPTTGTANWTNAHPDQQLVQEPPSTTQINATATHSCIVIIIIIIISSSSSSNNRRDVITAPCLNDVTTSATAETIHDLRLYVDSVRIL